MRLLCEEQAQSSEAMNQALREVHSLYEVQMDSKRVRRRLARVEKVYNALKRHLVEATIEFTGSKNGLCNSLGI
jgi:hypothetical protein